MLFFRKLIKEVKKAEANLASYSRKVDCKEKAELEQRKLDALMEITAYVKTYSWLSHKQSKEKIEFFLKNKLNYKATSEKFGTSLNSIEVSVSYASKKLYDLVGKNTLDMISEGRIDDALLQFRCGTNIVGIPDLLLGGVMELLPDPKADNLIKLEDCKSELKFLASYSKYIFSLRKDRNSNDKLAHILHIISGNESKYAKERDIVYKFLSGNLTLEGLETALNALTEPSIFD